MNLKKYGAFMITKTALERYSTPNYWYKDEQSSSIDNGWRIIGAEDSDEFISDPENWTIININDALEICPFVVNFFDLPINSELFVEFDEHNTVVAIINLNTDEKIIASNINNYFAK